MPPEIEKEQVISSVSKQKMCNACVPKFSDLILLSRSSNSSRLKSAKDLLSVPWKTEKHFSQKFPNTFSDKGDVWMMLRLGFLFYPNLFSSPSLHLIRIIILLLYYYYSVLFVYSRDDDRCWFDLNQIVSHLPNLFLSGPQVGQKTLRWLIRQLDGSLQETNRNTGPVKWLKRHIKHVEG